MLKNVYIVGSVRTPIGALNGVFSGTSARDLGGCAAREALTRSGLPSDSVDEIIFGNVLGAGLGQNISRQIGFQAGLKPTVGGTTINKVCGSGLKSVMLAAQAIQCGDAEVIIAGGAENMTQSPYLLKKARGGYRMGNGELIDSLVNDGLWDVYHDVHMGNLGEICGENYGFSRKDQDDFAIESYRRAIAAIQQGFFKDELIPVEVKNKRESVLISEDEGPSRFNEEKLRKLKAAFGEKGAITAGNASSVNDGAAAVVVCSEEVVQKYGIKPEVRIVGYGTASREPEWFTIAPVQAMSQLLTQCNRSANEVDLYEINEAFSVVPMAAMRDLHIPHDKVNVHGGAVALGHPIGASGTRTLVTLIHAMKRRGAKIGVDALCIGGGEGVAMMVESCAS
jgi:acetyl-CoA C-acetyltransferase